MSIDNQIEKEFERISKVAKKDTAFKPISLNDLFSMEFPENKWVIEKLIPHQGITLISGAPASFKTWLLLRMALDIARGKSLFGHFECEQNKVLIIDEENHLRIVRERFKSLDAGADLSIYYLSQKDFLISNKGMIENVLAICAEKEIGVIFIDSLVRINDAEENDASQMSEVFRGIKQFCQSGKTVIITHHERKDGAMKSSAQNRLRGSSDIQASVDCHLAIRRDKDDKNKILIEQAKLRIDEEIKPFEVAIKKNGNFTEFIYLGLPSGEISKKDQAKNVILLILEGDRDGLSRSALSTKVRAEEDIGEKSIREAVDNLVSDGIIVEKQGDRNTRICSLSKFYQDESIIQDALI
jgi:predicted ATP-dependent serine protease